jgi:hypothetical protein
MTTPANRKMTASITQRHCNIREKLLSWEWIELLLDRGSPLVQFDAGTYEIRRMLIGRELIGEGR